MNDPIITQNPIESGELYNVDGNTNTTTNPTTLTEYDIAKLIQEETTKQMPMTQGTLPPQYYYPSMGDNVIKGHTQTPIGSFALVSPSARFPMGVLDAMEREEAARKTQQMLEEFKPIDKKFYRTLNSSWNTEWLAYQKESYDNAINKAYEQAGSWTGARMTLRRDGTLEEMQAEFMSQQQLYDEAWKAAQDIIVASETPDAHYVSEFVQKSAFDFINTKFGDYETEEARFNALHDSRDKFVKAVGMENASSELRSTWAEMSVQDPSVARMLTDKGGSINTMARSVYTQSKKTGVALLGDKDWRAAMGADYDSQDGQYIREFVEGLVTSYNDNYGKSIRAGKDFAVPTFEEYADFTINHIKGQTESAAVQVVQPTQIAENWLNKQNWTEINAVQMPIAGRNTNVWSLPITKNPFLISGQQVDYVFDMNGNRQSASDFAGGMVIGVMKTNIDGKDHYGYQVVPKDKFTYNPNAKTEADMWRYTGSIDDSYIVTAQGMDNNFRKYANDNKLNVTGTATNIMQAVDAEAPTGISLTGNITTGTQAFNLPTGKSPITGGTTTPQRGILD